jgi:hypothetical protein
MVISPAVGAARRSDARVFVRRAALFTLGAIALYAATYALAETLVFRYGHRNRFYAVRSAPPADYRFVVLGASHAAVFDYRDMNARLEALTGARIMNLSVVGGGVTVNRLLLEYFLTRHRTSAVVYVVDSFAFYSPDWNERRLQDSRLFVRAPLDLALIPLLWKSGAPLSVALDYASGFSKINNPDRFAPDVSADEGPRFDRRYRPVAQVDEQRLDYLYPPHVDATTFQKYLDQFDALVAHAQARGIDVLAVKPPIPERVRRRLPNEPQFDAAVGTVLGRRGVELDDFSRAVTDERLFQDTDHLNRDGVIEFYQAALAPLLIRSLRHDMGRQ